MSASTPNAPQRPSHLDLSGINRTVGGQKVREVAYAVYPDGTPAGIIGDLYRHHAYREHRWTDEGVSMWAERYPEYNIQLPQ